ncbi:MAG TPA: hypothetical protein VMF35_13410 [Acidimicrobiales bacterium]|jgi:hypothetical protein|nr:hypothetical protein [Acidimicrobiales bacterium]
MSTVSEVHDLDLRAAKTSLRLAGFMLEPDTAAWLDQVIHDGSKRLKMQTFGSRHTRVNRRRQRDARRALTTLLQALAEAQANMATGKAIGLDTAQRVLDQLSPMPPWC